MQNYLQKPACVDFHDISRLKRADTSGYLYKIFPLPVFVKIEAFSAAILSELDSGTGQKRDRQGPPIKI
jgi:hypothetical protein